MPRLGRFQYVINTCDVLHTRCVEPSLERFVAMPGKNRNSVLPGGSSAEDAVESAATLGSKFQGLYVY